MRARLARLERSEDRAPQRERTHEDAKRARRSAPCTRGAGHCAPPGPWAALSCPRPCPALAFPPPSALLGCGGGRRRRTLFDALSLRFFSRLCPARRALSVGRARRAPAPAPTPAPLPLPRRHAAQQRVLPRARLRALSAPASATLAFSIVVVGDGVEKGRRCGARRCPFPHRGLRSWTTSRALSCILCWPASSPCARARGLHSINNATAGRSTAHRPSSRGALKARLGLRRVLLPVAFLHARHEHAASAHRPRPSPLLRRRLCSPSASTRRSRRCRSASPLLRSSSSARRPATRVDTGATTLRCASF